MTRIRQKEIQVFLSWKHRPVRFGTLTTTNVDNEETLAFSYDKKWLETAGMLVVDPRFELPSRPRALLDSLPDSWGRRLLQRNERYMARLEGRAEVFLLASDYLVQIGDFYRKGGMSFEWGEDWEIWRRHATVARPTMDDLPKLEQASLHLEQNSTEEDPASAQHLSMLVYPASALGGSRPKVHIKDASNEAWIAKLPSIYDPYDAGGWEYVASQIAKNAGVQVSPAAIKKYSHHHHSFLTKRFDRHRGSGIHFVSARTLLGFADDADIPANSISYLHLAEWIIRNSESPDADLEELWRRIILNICISNADDHIRNHGFLLGKTGWRLSPAFDINPVANAGGLTLNISEQHNKRDLDLARSVAEKFRIKKVTRENIIRQVTTSVSSWHLLASNIGLPEIELQMMENAFYK